jgi:hypothetical protein
LSPLSSYSLFLGLCFSRSWCPDIWYTSRVMSNSRQGRDRKKRAEWCHLWQSRHLPINPGHCTGYSHAMWPCLDARDSGAVNILIRQNLDTAVSEHEGGKQQLCLPVYPGAFVYCWHMIIEPLKMPSILLFHNSFNKSPHLST